MTTNVAMKLTRLNTKTTPDYRGQVKQCWLTEKCIKRLATGNQCLTMNMRLHWGSFSVASIMNSSTVWDGWRVRNLIRGSLNGLPAWHKRDEWKNRVEKSSHQHGAVDLLRRTAHSVFYNNTGRRKCQNQLSSALSCHCQSSNSLHSFPVYDVFTG